MRSFGDDFGGGDGSVVRRKVVDHGGSAVFLKSCLGLSKNGLDSLFEIRRKSRFDTLLRGSEILKFSVNLFLNLESSHFGLAFFFQSGQLVESLLSLLSQ